MTFCMVAASGGARTIALTWIADVRCILVPLFAQMVTTGNAGEIEVRKWRLPPPFYQNKRPKVQLFRHKLERTLVLLDSSYTTFFFSCCSLLPSSHEPGSNTLLVGECTFMKRQWTDEELEAHFTLHSAERDLVGDSKTDHNLLGFAVLLKYFQCEGRFPSQKQDIPAAVTRHIAHQLGVATEELLAYDFDGRMIKTHRAAIRAFLDFRETTRQDEEALVSWLCQEVLGEQQQEDALLAAAYQHCQKQHVEPPTPDRLSRLLHTALHQFDEQFCVSVSQQLTPEVRARLDGLLTTIISEEPSSAEANIEAPVDQEGTTPPAKPSRSVRQSLKQDAGQMSLVHTLEEIAKLERIDQIGLPAALFAQTSPKLLQ